jgi:hypothetical protein
MQLAGVEEIPTVRLVVLVVVAAAAVEITG